MLIKEPSLHGLIAKSIFPALSRSGDRLCARKNISPSLTLKSELEAMNIGRSNLLSSAASRYVLFLNVDGMDGIPLNRRRPLTKIRKK